MERGAEPDRRAAAGGLGGYRPYLDGLRVVAVYLVVLFHAGADRLSGGFIGVDVFFVLSGFLVTRLLMRDLAGSGAIGFRRFYARRFRRLLPAAAVVLIVSALVFSAIASPIEVAEAEDGFRAAFLYVTNWYFISESTQYFGADLETNPVLHFWSLAVEEQFYLLWPLLLGGLYAVAGRFGARRWKVLRVIVAVAAVASLALAWTWRTSDPVRAYYGTDTRAYQLFAGALLALTPGLLARVRGMVRPARVVAPVGLVALGVLASSAVSLDPIERGLAATLATLAVVVALETGGGGIAHWVLSRPAMVYLGKISYGTYLWHWPVIWVMARSFDLSVLSTIALTTLVATALASLSYELLEHPVRMSSVLDQHRGAVIAGGLAVSLVAGLVVIPAIVARATSSAAAPGNGIADPNAVVGFTPVPDDIDFAGIRADRPEPPNCLDQDPSQCTIVRGDGAHVLLIGDSHAAMLISVFTKIAEDNDLTLSVATRGGCPWQRGLYGPSFALPGGGSIDQRRCAAFKEDLYTRVLPELDPDVVVGMNFAYELPNQPIRYLGPDLGRLTAGSPEYEAWLRETTTESLRALEAEGRSVVIVEAIPQPREPLDQLACLATAAVVQECRSVVDQGPSVVEQLYRGLDEDDDRVWALDLDRSVCPFLPICDPIVDDEVVKVDQNHLTRAFADTLAPAITTYLVDNGIIDG